MKNDLSFMQNHIPFEKRHLPLEERGTYVGSDIHHSNCFGCGAENPASMKIPSTFDENNQRVFFEYIFGKNYEGAPNYVHGGILSAILDEAQGVLCHHIGYFVMTDSLSIKYLKAVPLDTPVLLEAYSTIRKRKRLYTRASIYDKNSGSKLVESSARWYIISEKVLVRKLSVDKDNTVLERIRTALKVNKERIKTKQ